MTPATATITEPRADEVPGGEGWARRALARVRRTLHSHGNIAPAVVLGLTLIAFSLMSDRFGSVANASLILQQAAIIGILAIAQTVIILTAGIDLSVGAIMVFISLVVANASTTFGMDPLLALILGFVVGCVCGALNGALVAGLRLPPFIVTLGTLSIFTALSLYISQGRTITGLSPLLTWPGTTFQVGDARISYGVVLFAIVAVFAATLLRRTAFGRHVFAVGGDPEVARLAGIRVRWNLLAVYTLAGAIYAIGAWVQMGRTESASPLVGGSYNLDTVTAVVIGGTSLFGGRGSVLGTVLGVLIVSSFRNGLALAGVEVLWQNFAIGVLTIVAVALDQWIRKVKA